MAEKFSVIAKSGMVASSQPLATLAGVEILMNGGNAIDAAIATAAVLGVIEPSPIGIGSDAFCLFYSAKDKAIKALDASGRSPYAASLDICRRNGFKEMPQRGIHSVTVPGAVHGWGTLLNSHGTKPLSEVFHGFFMHTSYSVLCVWKEVQSFSFQTPQKAEYCFRKGWKNWAFHPSIVDIRRIAV